MGKVRLQVWFPGPLSNLYDKPAQKLRSRSVSGFIGSVVKSRSFRAFFPHTLFPYTAMISSELPRLNIPINRQNLVASRDRAAFTLIELLTVIAIIGILAAIIIPVVGKVRNTAQSARCVSNIRQLGLQINLYAGESKGELPNLSGLTDSAILDPRIVDHGGGQLAYRLWRYYTSVPLAALGDARAISVHEMLICPAMESVVRPKIAGARPSGVGDKSATVAQSYIINDVQNYTEGGSRYTVFGYNGSKSFNLGTIEKKFKIPNKAVTLSQIWTLQDGDRALPGRTAQLTFVAEQPAHKNSRNRGFLDGSVRKMSIEESDGT